MSCKCDENTKITLEMCLGMSNYPRNTIWDIRMKYFGRFWEKSKRRLRSSIWGGLSVANGK